MFCLLKKALNLHICTDLCLFTAEQAYSQLHAAGIDAYAERRLLSWKLSKKILISAECEKDFYVFLVLSRHSFSAFGLGSIFFTALRALAEK